jgi:hypothetical protein
MPSLDGIERGAFFCRRSFYVAPLSREKDLPTCGLEYNDQPNWGWGDLELNSVDTIKNALREFHGFADEASRQFEWPTAYQKDFKDWEINKHSWKHVSYSDLKRRVDDIIHVRGKARRCLEIRYLRVRLTISKT